MSQRATETNIYRKSGEGAGGGVVGCWGCGAGVQAIEITLAVHPKYLYWSLVPKAEWINAWVNGVLTMGMDVGV